MQPTLFTYDIFGTVLDWQRGLRDALAEHGHSLTEDEFDLVVDTQGKLESPPFRPYSDIVAESLVEVLELDPEAARTIGQNVGRGALYPDSSEGLSRLMRVAPCIATTNSDRAHRGQVEEQLGFALSDWYCAEDTRVYKPAPEFWKHVAERRKIAFDKSWWHVSAYADYDLEVAQSLGLTTVFICRPHCRLGKADHEFDTLVDLARFLER